MNIGFCGCGNMATAMIKGILSVDSGACSAGDSGISSDGGRAYKIYATCASEKTREHKTEELGIEFCNSNDELAEKCDIIFLAVKPNMYETVLEEIKDQLSAEKTVVSMAPGKSISWLQEMAGQGVQVVRIMPNTPAMVGAGMTSVTAGDFVSDESFDAVKRMMESFGEVAVVKEGLIDAVGAVSGSSPAYVFMFIEAMADAAVREGMARKDAYTFASQAVLGSAKMVLELGMHPGELKDMVCSPGGSTIEGVAVLEEMGFRGAVMEAIKACADKAKMM